MNRPMEFSTVGNRVSDLQTIAQKTWVNIKKGIKAAPWQDECRPETEANTHLRPTRQPTAKPYISPPPPYAAIGEVSDTSCLGDETELMDEASEAINKGEDDDLTTREWIIGLADIFCCCIAIPLYCLGECCVACGEERLASQKKEEEDAGLREENARLNQTSQSVVMTLSPDASAPARSGGAHAHPWTGCLRIRTEDLAGLMRKGLHITEGHIQRDSTSMYHGRQVYSDTGVAFPKGYDFHCRYALHNPDDGWSGDLVISGNDITTLSKIKIKDMGWQNVRSARAHDSSGGWVYSHSTPSHVSFNLIQEDVRMEGWWPWPRPETDTDA